MISKILVPIDLSEVSIKAADFAFQMANQLNAKLSFISVMENSMLVANPDAGEFPDEKRLKVKADFIALIKDLENKHPKLLVEKVFITEGSTVRKIIEKAEKWQADIIVMGSHGRTGISHFLMGSIAEAVMRHGEIPVLIVKRNT